MLVEDARLARALRADPNDREVAAETFRRFAPLVYRILQRALGHEDVVDVVQEVFLRVYTRVHTLQDPLLFRGFIMGITFNVLRREIRRRKLRRILRPFTSTDAFEGSGIAPDLEARDTARHFARVLDGLSPAERMVFELRFVERMTVEEVAAALGVSQSTAKRRAEEARGKVVTALADEPALVAHLRFRTRGDER